MLLIEGPRIYELYEPPQTLKTSEERERESVYHFQIYKNNLLKRLCLL